MLFIGEWGTAPSSQTTKRRVRINAPIRSIPGSLPYWSLPYWSYREPTANTMDVVRAWTWGSRTMSMATHRIFVAIHPLQCKLVTFSQQRRHVLKMQQRGDQRYQSSHPNSVDTCSRCSNGGINGTKAHTPTSATKDASTRFNRTQQ
jgi:hypothetical protein